MMISYSNLDYIGRIISLKNQLQPITVTYLELLYFLNTPHYFNW